MKRFNVFLICGVFGLMVTGCAGVHQHLTSNLNSTATNVVLSGNNYKIIQHVKGSAVSKKSTIKDMLTVAREDMMKNVEMVGYPRAIINESVEIHHKMTLFGLKWYTISVSAYVIEFTDGQKSGASQVKNDQPAKKEGAEEQSPFQPKW